MTAPAPGGAPAPSGPPLSGGQSTVGNVHAPGLTKTRRRLPKPNETCGEARLSEGCMDEAADAGGLWLSQGLGQDY